MVALVDAARDIVNAPPDTRAPRTRLPALDGLRAIAITMVVICHVQVFLHPLSGPIGFFCTEVAWSGVYLFFVLSGYLIGTLVLEEIAATGTLAIRAFWGRRALRTWPLYFLALAGNVWLASPEAPPRPGLWSYLTFTQAFFSMNYFIESWTLSVEELFYFVLPLVVVGVVRLAGVRAIGTACVAVIAASWLFRARTGYWPHPGATFDSLMIGVLIARLQASGHAVFDSLRRWATLTTVAGIAMAAVPFALGHHFQWRQLQGHLGIGFGLVLVAALNPTALASRLLAARVLKVVAVSSYSTYLSHMFVLRLMLSMGAAPAEPGTPTARITFVLATVVILTCGWLVYTLIEAPGLRLRELLLPRRVHAATRHAGLHASARGPAAGAAQTA